MPNFFAPLVTVITGVPLYMVVENKLTLNSGGVLQQLCFADKLELMYKCLVYWLRNSVWKGKGMVLQFFNLRKLFHPPTSNYARQM